MSAVGFVIWDYYDRWQEFLEEVSPLVAKGEIKFEETEMRAFDKLPEALAGLLKGINTGKVRGHKRCSLPHSTKPARSRHCIVAHVLIMCDTCVTGAVVRWL